MSLEALNQQLPSGYEFVSCTWQDASRATNSALGSNITDVFTAETSPDGSERYGVRLTTTNFDPKLAEVDTEDVRVKVGDEAVSLRDLLKGLGAHFSYAGVDAAADLSSEADRKARLQIDALFAPVGAAGKTEYKLKAFNYAARAGNPKNLRLFATPAGAAVWEESSGPGDVCLDAEQGGALRKKLLCAEPSERKLGAAAEGAAAEGAAFVGLEAWGPATNRFLFVQVPLSQKRTPIGLGYSLPDGDPGEGCVYRSLGAVCEAKLTRGSDAGEKTKISCELKRAAEPLLVGVTLVYTYPEDQLPSLADARLAIAEIERLYALAGQKHRLMDEGAGLTEGPLTNQAWADIAAKVNGVSAATLPAPLAAPPAPPAPLPLAA